MIDVLRHPDTDDGRSFAPLLLSWLHWVIPSPVVPDAYLEASPLPDAVVDFVFDYCATDASGKRRLHTESAIVFPKGAAKSELAAMLSLAEVFGPSVPAGIASGGETFTAGDFAYEFEPGEVMATVRPNAHVTVLATTKEQAEKTCYSSVWRWAGGLMADDSTGGASLRLIEAYHLEPRDHVAKLRLTTPQGATIRVIAAEHGADAADGGRETLVVADESHRMTGSIVHTFHALAANAAKRGGNILHSTTVHAIGENSVLEGVFELATDIRAHMTPARHLLVHHSVAPADADWLSLDGVRAALQDTYTVAPWVDIEPILAKFFDRRQDIGQLKRLYGGVPCTPSARWLDAETLRAATAGRHATPPPGARIALGLDASRGVKPDSKYHADCTALIGALVPTAPGDPIVIFPVRIWVPRTMNWTLDYEELDDAVRQAFRTWNVVGFYADPPLIEAQIAEWERTWGGQLSARATAQRPIGWHTGRLGDMGRATEAYEDGLITGDIVLVNDPVLVEHHTNAHRRETRSGYVIGKERRHSNHKIDAATSAVIAVAACRDAIREGASTSSVASGPTTFVEPEYY